MRRGDVSSCSRVRGEASDVTGHMGHGAFLMGARQRGSWVVRTSIPPEKLLSRDVTTR